MARPHKGQHKVPKTYLQAFTNERGTFWVVNPTGKQVKLYEDKPANVLTEKDYYTIKFPGGKGSLVVETKVLGSIEGAYAKLYSDKISQKKPLTPLDRATLCIFVAAMLERSPARRRALQDFFDQVKRMTDHMRSLPDSAKQAMASMPRDENAESIPADELLKAGKDVGSFHSSSIPEGIQAIAPMLFEMKLGFLVREGSTPFITSDSPCNLANPSLPPRSWMRPGLGQKDVEVTLPLSADIAVLFGWHIQRDGMYVPMPEKNTQEINRRTMGYATYLLSADKALMERKFEDAKRRKQEQKADVS